MFFCVRVLRCGHFFLIYFCKYFFIQIINIKFTQQNKPIMKINEVKVQYSKKIAGKISNVQSAVDYCKSIPEFENRMEYQEVFAVVYVDNGLNILCHQIIGIGAISAAMTDIRIIMSTALKTLSTQMILCHNHPSGNLKPSEADIKLTKEIKNAASFFKITVIDHIILTKKSYYSFNKNGIL